jgi:hypothetical protein
MGWTTQKKVIVGVSSAVLVVAVAAVLLGVFLGIPAARSPGNSTSRGACELFTKKPPRALGSHCTTVAAQFF